VVALRHRVETWTPTILDVLATAIDVAERVAATADDLRERTHVE